MFGRKQEKLRQIPKFTFSNRNVKPRFAINQIVKHPVGAEIIKIQIKHIRIDIATNGDVDIKYYANEPREGFCDVYYHERDLYLCDQEIKDEIGKRS